MTGASSVSGTYIGARSWEINRESALPQTMPCRTQKATRVSMYPPSVPDYSVELSQVSQWSVPLPLSAIVMRRGRTFTGVKQRDVNMQIPTGSRLKLCLLAIASQLRSRR